MGSRQLAQENLAPKFSQPPGLLYLPDAWVRIFFLWFTPRCVVSQCGSRTADEAAAVQNRTFR
jgi:hypothetical protein